MAELGIPSNSRFRQRVVEMLRQSFHNLPAHLGNRPRGTAAIESVTRFEVVSFAEM